LSSTFDFDDFVFSVDEAVSVVIVFVVGIVVSDLELEALLTAGVAPGSDDNVAPVVVVVVGEKGTSGSLGKLSVYNTLAGLLHRTNRCNKNVNQREKKRKTITSSQHPNSNVRENNWNGQSLQQ
jgi:hypothetical protein